MSKYDIFAISIPDPVELGPIFHSLMHMFPVRLILSGVLDSYLIGKAADGDTRRHIYFMNGILSGIHDTRKVIET